MLSSTLVSSIGNLASDAFRKAKERTQQSPMAADGHKFYFDVLQQSYRHHHIAFRLSMIFFSVGVAVIVAGVVLGFVIPGATGAVSIGGGLILSGTSGAFAVHANRARKDLLGRSTEVYQAVERDASFRDTLKAIDGVEDPAVRDRLRATLAVWRLESTPGATKATIEPPGTGDRQLPE
ncbi:hypothetical protein FNQ90_02430 [Streptomyces alkaliphilus]|uniref:Cyanobacterial TRADD-N associated 2 transmembrane domain-containing protein n=1 Tax=Streptomyces alkaliphilus TaxID=1472722 RepID=A0A7W3TA26_9ACTN|nr:hypothetical protein [Streptomyces alkaliphilus]MBB0242992.1 hypothetical protein [Streptomyces alkaliphilus]